ncbi:MAG: hypothetical protein HY296_05465 [Thaumarchaeota archaeon]|nr:hypothetical protein [Nitrososphaerota archaeon]
MAIEFAFFGLGSETGGSLLKVGEREASVRMVFEVDGKEFRVSRGLVRKGDKVQQTEGSIRTPEGEVDLSPSELKEKILEILRFNEAPDPKAQSRIYRYAVYTPQEEMKSVLAMPQEDRLQILRRAFGIEDYRTAVNNSETVAREIKARIRESKAAASEAGELRTRIEVESEDIGAQREDLKRSEQAEAKAAQELGELKAERGKLQTDEMTSLSLTREISSQQRMIRRMQDEGEALADEEERVAGRLRHLEEEISAAGSEAPAESAEEVGAKVAELEDRSRRLAILKDRAEQKVGEYRTLIEDGVCPVCEKPVEAHEYSTRETAKKAEMTHLAAEASACEAELATAKKSLEARRSHDAAVQRRMAQQEEVEEGRNLAGRTQERRAKLAKDVGDARAVLDDKNKEFEKLRGLSERLERLDESISRKEKVLDSLRRGSSATKARVEEKEKALAEDRSRLAKAESAEAEISRLSEYQLWVEDYFAPTVGEIERTVMANIKEEFDTNFRKWFSMLVGDEEKEAWIDDSFTPVVSEGGYEQETAYLSGGERTSVALAYRLALNTLVQRVSTGMKSNLVILDEPTDGFSKEQLGSVREILDEIASPQIIVVSHEKELESFADQIFRVSKARGESKIVPGA